MGKSYRAATMTDHPIANTLDAVLSRIRRSPADVFIRNWNWKSALISCLVRGSIFYVAASRNSASRGVDAALTEMAIFASMAGFTGALVQSFRRVQPAWKSHLAVTILLIAILHSVEWLVHLARDTPRLLPAVVASVIFTVISTNFTLLLMRNGLFVTDGEHNFLQDFFHLPSTLLRVVRGLRR